MKTPTSPWVLPVVRAAWRNVDMQMTGTSVTVARRWQKVRREMTAGLRRRVAENVN